MFDKRWKKKQIPPCEHYTDGRDAWKKEAFGLVAIQLRYIVSLLVFLLLMIWLFLPAEPSVNLRIIVVTSVSLCFAILTLSLIYLGRRSRRSLEIKYQLHMLAHLIRDKYAAINFHTNINIEDMSNSLCNHIQGYFSHLTGNEHIGVAIRIASAIENKTAFVTVGRANLNLDRASNSTPLYEDEGVAKIFKDDRVRRGVLYIKDVESAAKEGFFLKHKNDIDFPKDYKSMMVSPIVGWDGKAKGMIGILYVTSGDHNVFSQKHTDSVGFVADSLANLYSELPKTKLTGDKNERYRFQKHKL